MLKSLWYSVVAAFMVSTAAAVEPIFTWNFDKQEQIDFACNVLYLSDEVCETIEYPKIEIIYYPGAFGAYGGGDTIYITIDGINQDSEGAYKTLLHELVHYIDVKHRGYVNTPTSICQTETNAWFVSNVWWNYIGKPERVVYNWRERYPRCNDWQPVDFGSKLNG